MIWLVRPVQAAQVLSCKLKCTYLFVYDMSRFVKFLTPDDLFTAKYLPIESSIICKGRVSCTLKAGNISVIFQTLTFTGFINIKDSTVYVRTLLRP